MYRLYMLIIRNVNYQWLLYTPHCLLELSNTAFSLHEITTISSSHILTNPPPPTTHMPSYTAICVIFLSNSMVLNYILHDSTNSSGGTRWKELGHLRQVFKVNGYPETVVNRNLRTRPTPSTSNQTSQTPPKLLLLPYIPELSESIEMCRPLGVKTFSRSSCTLRSSLVHVKQPREDKRKKGVIYEVPCKDCECVYIGETGRTLEKQLSEHKNAVKKHDTKKGIAVHS